MSHPADEGTPTRLLWASALGAATLALAVGVSLLWRFPPFLDEAIYSGWTERIAESSSERFVPLANGKEPLLEWLAAALTTLGPGPFTAGRLVSLAASLGTLGLVVALGWLVAGKRVALASGVLAAVCPFLVVYGVLGLYEALATFLTTAALVLQVLLVRTLRLDVALLLGVTFGLGLLTKQSALFAVALWPLSLLVADWSREGLPRRLLRLAGLALAGGIVSYAIFSILQLSEFRDDLDRQRDLYPVHSVREGLSSAGMWLEQNWPGYRDVLAVYLTPAVILAAAVGVGLGLRRSWRVTSLVAAWGLLPLVAAALLADAPYPRYVHAAAPPLLVLAGAGCVWTGEAAAGALRARGRPLSASLALPLVVGVVALGPLVYDLRMAVSPASVTYPGLDDEQFVTGWTAGTGLKTLRTELEGRAGRSGPATVLVGTSTPPSWLTFAMRNDARFRFVAPDSDDPSALYAIENGAPLPPRSDPLAWNPVRRVERPRGGVPLILHESGVRFGEYFFSSPEELRQLITPDERFDAYVEARPAVKAWLEAWYLANA
jgi:4-amino-4-deoxy-L-arabinose transferase-like glycosyltransferase